jgi:hypothetical protein
METSSLRTLKVMPRNLSKIVRPWIWLLAERYPLTVNNNMARPSPPPPPEEKSKTEASRQRWCGLDVDSHLRSLFIDGVNTKSNDWYRGATELVQHFRLQAEFTSAKDRLNLIWFGSIAYPIGEEGRFYLFKWFYLPSLRLEEGWGGQHPVGLKALSEWSMVSVFTSTCAYPPLPKSTYRTNSTGFYMG